MAFTPKHIAYKEGCEIVEAFGQQFVVRQGADNIKDIWWEITADCDTIPEMLITILGTDGQDGLCWTSWEDCLVEWAVHPWGIDSNLLTESTLYNGARTEQEDMDLMDVIAGVIARLEEHPRYKDKQNPLSSRLLSQLGYQVGKRALKPEILDPVWRTKVGLGKLLRIAAEKGEVDPTDVASEAAEDGNHHTLAAVLRFVRDASEHTLNSIKDTWYV